MRRKRLSKRASARKFRRSSGTKKINVAPPIYRGGIRL